MEPPRNPNPLAFAAEQKEQERRRHGRLLCEDLRCSLGQIRDLSASGMKVFRKGGAIAKVGDRLQVIIEYLDSCMAVDVVTVRADRVGFRKHLYGFEFVELTGEQRQRLSVLARVAADRLTFAQKK